jgi:ABC-type cobalamin/Fe3+-siderophores transport system ATPase subunit/SAM-dependent methyltransferase
LKIEGLNLAKTTQREILGMDLGLSDVHMNRLGKTVVLTGPNGSGKSRLLRALITFNYARNEQPINAIENLEKMREQNLAYLAVHEKIVRNQETTPNQIDPSYQHARIQIQQINNQLPQINRTITLLNSIRTSSMGKIEIFSYSVKSTTLASAEQLPPTEMKNRYSQMASPGAENAHQLASSYIKQVLMAGFNASHQNRKPSLLDSEHILASQTLLKNLKELLSENANPSFESEGHISLFGHKDYENILSDGQKVLLQLGCALHAQGVALSKAIILLDEPENHLHPSALVEVYDRLNEITSDGQIWIATHSIPLIAHLAAKDPNCVWYMQNGSVEHAGKKPEMVLEGLMGGVNGAQELQNFTLLPGQLAINRFLAECLLPPTTVGPAPKDPQTNSISDLIKKRKAALASGEKLRVLDFGAGKGRLLASLTADVDQAKTSDVIQISNWLDYVAFDSFDKDADICKLEIASSYGENDCPKRYFGTLSALETDFDASSFDLIVMCNVLHELPPDQWTTLFGASGKLTKLLKPDGGLLLVEDYQIPAGELAHKYGFLLLDEPELKELFCWCEADKTSGLVLREKSIEPRYKDRLIMHWITQSLVAKVTVTSRCNAIKKLHEFASEKISTLKEKKTKSSKDGHLYALAAQTYTNASLWLEGNEH